MSGAIPFIICVASVIVLFSKKDLFTEFLDGCRSGIELSVNILPSLVLLVCAVSMFRASGALDTLCKAFSPLLKGLCLPGELVPVIFTRAVSGSSATAATNELFKSLGPDSKCGYTASLFMGSTDTIIYTLSMYFAHTKTKRTRHALPCSFIVMIFCAVLSGKLADIFF